MNFKKVCLAIFNAVFCLFIVLSAFSPAQPSDTHGFVIFVKGKKYVLHGYKKKFVRVDELAKIFSARATKLQGGKAVRIGHLYYDKGLKQYKNRVYVNALEFFRFFNMPGKKISDWYYRMKVDKIPMLDRSSMTYKSEGNLKLEDINIYATICYVRNRKYVELESLLNIIKATPSWESDGILLINGERVDRWFKAGGKVFVYTRDVSKATGKDIR